jgi:hypothetical protein
MNELERQIADLKLLHAEAIALSAQVQAQTAIATATALRRVLASRSAQFDADFLKELENGVQPSLTEEQVRTALETPGRIQSLIEELERRKEEL